MRAKEWINQLSQLGSLPREGYRALLLLDDKEDAPYLHQRAREVAQLSFGREVYLRGLVEITNRCRNNCYYCGIRSANMQVNRYSLSHDEVLECCRVGSERGFRTFVLQGGDDSSMSDDWIVELVAKIRQTYPDSAITLSLGERGEELFRRAFEAGANRYLLRHETHNPEHYRELHPRAMSLDNRLQSLDTLKRIGYQCGTGIMVGSPHQTLDHIIEDVKYIEGFKPEMVGIGPFIPHSATPFASFPSGSIELTLRLISIFRLMNPKALIPATTALATIDPDGGRERGILAGANVIMPNISPLEVRGDYSLYNDKASLGAESGEGLRLLEETLARIGYKISFKRGDYE
ncbi:MAG: [FeFe] hydrogenase H-cluster radical SAM maturase HydE [Rikenellaceae bacterium]